MADTEQASPAGADDGYKWVALANTTPAVFMSMLDVGRLGDMFGRVRIYNAGFAVFTFASVLLPVSFPYWIFALLLLSIGAFFSLMIAGLASSLPKTLTSGLEH